MHLNGGSLSGQAQKRFIKMMSKVYDKTMDISWE